MPSLGAGGGLSAARSVRSVALPVTSLIGNPSFDDPDWSIEVSWVDSIGCPFSYDLEIKGIADNAWIDRQTVNRPSLTYTYSGLSAGIYQVRVRANFDCGCSRWTATEAIECQA